MYCDVRKRLFQMELYNTGSLEMQHSQARQLLEVLQPGVNHLNAVEIQRLQARQPLEMHQPGSVTARPALMRI